MIDEIRRLLAPLLARPLRPTERDEIAEALALLTEQQRQLARADRQIGHVIRREQIAQIPHSRKGGRPKGSGARFLRFEQYTGRSNTLHVGRALWQELGQPKRLDIQRIGSNLILRPVGGNDGYAVTQPPNGMPRFSIGHDASDALGLIPGRFAAEIKNGAIITQ